MRAMRPNPGRTAAMNGRPEPAVSVFVVNFNGGEYLARCIEALRGQTVEGFEALIADNGSVDGSFVAARDGISDPRFRFVPFGENLGFAAANNRLAEIAAAPWIALLNPDAFPEPDWLEKLLAAAERHGDVALFGSTQLDAGDPGILDGAGDAYFAAGLPWRGGHGRKAAEGPGEREVFGACAAAAFYRADVFRVLGGFEERFFCYIEDVDFAFRARLLGHRTVQVADATVRHVGGATGGGAGSDFARYHGIRNLVWCFVRNMPGVLFWPLLPFHLAALAYLLVRAVPRGQAGLTCRALRDALGGMGATWRERRALQAARTAPAFRIARALTWSPLKYLRRS